jgi:hypothetical protein
MTESKKWPLVTAITAYWLVLVLSILAFAVLFVGVGMTPGNYHLKTSELVIFSLFPAALLGCKFLIYKLRQTPGGINLLTLASVVPLIQILIIFILI